LVEQILQENPDPGEKYLEILADYLVLCMEKQEKKERKLLTDNRMMTVNKRETSFEGLVSQLENGEDGIYNLISENKYTIFQPKVTITKKDLEEIQPLRQLREAIDLWEAKLKVTEGKDAFIIKKALIEMRKDQYIIKNAYRKPIVPTKITRSRNFIPLDDNTCRFDEEGYPIPEGISLLDPKVCSAILCNYSKLKQDSWGQFEADTWFLMHDFDEVAAAALKDYPLYERIVEYKIDGMQNVDIQAAIQEEFGIKHSLEYISSLWRNKIPKLIASTAEDQYLDWYYREVEKGKYKKCSRCGQIKLAHNKYFSKNKTAKDGFYSICKCCRNAKGKKA
jgi:antirestriction protein